MDKKEEMRKMIFIWLRFLFVLFSFQLFVGDIIDTVDRFTHQYEIELVIRLVPWIVLN